MGWLVLKVNPDPAEDRWCLWSTIADGPVFDGTEEDMTRLYLFENGHQVRDALMRRIERAKVHGAGSDWDGDFDCGSLSMEVGRTRGSLPRHKLADMLDLIARKASEEEMGALIEPYIYEDD